MRQNLKFFARFPRRPVLNQPTSRTGNQNSNKISAENEPRTRQNLKFFAGSARQFLRASLAVWFLLQAAARFNRNQHKK